MSSKRFLTSRTFLIQLAIAFAIVVVLVFITLKGLDMYTRHGQSNPVPDFYGMNPAEAQKVASSNNMKIEIVDSVFVNDVAPGGIVDQVPEAGHGVKHNRTIFVSINSTLPEMVTLPQLTDISFRQAQVLIENSGLQIGQLNYSPSQFNNLVLEVLYNDETVRSGQKLPKGSTVDLIIGRTQGNTSTLLPNLTGLTFTEAEQAITDAMLNTGVVIFDNSVVTGADSLQARVWRQRPAPTNNSMVLLGSFIDLWLTADTLKLNTTQETGIGL